VAIGTISAQLNVLPDGETSARAQSALPLSLRNLARPNFQRPGCGDGMSAMDGLMLSMLGAVPQFERSMIRERQAKGIKAAKDRGVYKGGKPKLADERFWPC
jgi:hypothetical protein